MKTCAGTLDNVYIIMYFGTLNQSAVLTIDINIVKYKQVCEILLYGLWCDE